MAGDPSKGKRNWVRNVFWMARVDLRRVARARRHLEEAVKERDEAIRAAVASGETYRDVGRMAGLSHQRVAQIVAGK